MRQGHASTDLRAVVSDYVACPLPKRTAADDVDGSGGSRRSFVNGDEGEVHGEFDAFNRRIAALIIPIVAQIGFIGGRERVTVPILDRRKRIQALRGEVHAPSAKIIGSQAILQLRASDVRVDGQSGGIGNDGSQCKRRAIHQGKGVNHDSGAPTEARQWHGITRIRICDIRLNRPIDQILEGSRIASTGAQAKGKGHHRC